MQTVVVYESMYGNTHAIAQAVAEGLAPMGDVVVGSTEELTPPDVAEAGLLVVGGPTHVHGMTTEPSRRSAVEAAEQDDELDLDEHASGPGLRNWMRELPSATGAFGVAFDTRIDKPVIFTGSAAKGITKRLARHSFRGLADPESFFVDVKGTELLDGEVDRARAWGASLAAKCRELHAV